MRKHVLFLMISIFICTAATQAYCAETTLFGAIDTRYTQNENVQDTQSDQKDTMNFTETKLIFGIKNRFDDNVTGVAAFEAGGIIWGIDGAGYPVGQNSGGAASGDGVNVETKNIYVDIDIPGDDLNVKCGLMPFNIADGILAGDDAFGTILTLDDELFARVNIINIYQEALGTRYDYNTADPDRKEYFLDLEISQPLGDDFSMDGLFGALIDRYNGEETKELDRNIYYVGLGFTGKLLNTTNKIEFISNSGNIKSSDVEGNPAKGEEKVDAEANGYLLNAVSGIQRDKLSGFVQFLYASGENKARDTADKYEGFIAPETSYKTDIAEILTRGELADELTGDEEFNAYRYLPDFSNVFFFKGAIGYELGQKTDIAASMIIASLAKEEFISGSDEIKAHKIGTEFDLKLSRKIYTADDQEKGLRLDLIGALLISGDVFDEYDSETGSVNEANNVYEFGAKLIYEF